MLKVSGIRKCVVQRHSTVLQNFVSGTPCNNKCFINKV